MVAAAAAVVVVVVVGAPGSASVREKLVPRAIMANPRKFSEKIALLNQKEAQDSAAFEAIMKEVSNVTSRVRKYQYCPLAWVARCRAAIAP